MLSDAFSKNKIIKKNWWSDASSRHSVLVKWPAILTTLFVDNSWTHITNTSPIFYQLIIWTG